MSTPNRLRPVLLGVALLAGAACAPAPAEPATTTVAAGTVPAPAIIVDGVRRADLDLCAALGAARDGSVVTIRGDRRAPIDLTRQRSTAATAGRCRLTPTARNVTVRTEGSPLVLGQMTLGNLQGWLIDGLAMTRPPGGDRQALLALVGGTGWRLTGCELWGSAAMTDLSVGHWTGAIPTDFEVDHCFVHDNPGADTTADNQNDNLYVFTADDVDANGHIHDNVFVGAPRGFNVKIGGTGLRSGEGSDGILFEHNTLVNHGALGTSLLVSTDSDDVTVRNNVFVGQGDSSLYNVALGSFTGSDLRLHDNLFWGYDPNRWPEPRPILWSYNGSFDAIDLNESNIRVEQWGNRRYNPGYPSLSAWNPDPGRFPSVALGGMTYGPRR